MTRSSLSHGLLCFLILVFSSYYLRTSVLTKLNWSSCFTLPSFLSRSLFGLLLEVGWMKEVRTSKECLSVPNRIFSTAVFTSQVFTVNQFEGETSTFASGEDFPLDFVVVTNTYSVTCSVWADYLKQSLLTPKHNHNSKNRGT